MPPPLSERVADLDSLSMSEFRAAWDAIEREIPPSDRKRLVAQASADVDDDSWISLLKAVLKLSIWLEGWEAAGGRLAGNSGEVTFDQGTPVTAERFTRMCT